MHETVQDISWLRELLDRSYERAGDHLKSITTPARRIPAAEVVELLPGVQIINLATVTADGRPMVAPVDGLFYRSHFYFSSAKNSVRYRHLIARPRVSATHTRGEEISIVVHGTARLFALDDAEEASFKDYCFEVYVPLYGDTWTKFALQPDIFFARIDPELMFTLRVDEPTL
ncbi:MAG TPA: pyridoxamine 5'-phosphate oxidase family protein [Candidatus Dormibacteraeota bacterium]|nr:pyridoxamine 5'-phosphate oxidase family protein [Candidatus Dormibacteraeota bacterium]